MIGHQRAPIAVAALLLVPTLALAAKRPATSAGFTLATARSTLVVERGATRVLAVRVRRATGFDGPVALGAWRLPRGARIVWTLPDGRALPRKRPGRRVVLLPPHADVALLHVTARASTRLGRFRVRISALAPHRRSRRWLAVGVRAPRVTPAPSAPAVVTPGPQQPHAPSTFGISGRPAAALRPGSSAPIELEISNPHDGALAIDALRVEVQERTSKPGCSGRANYSVRQFAGRFPLVVPRGRTRLGRLVADHTLWPQITMRNLPVSQDACKGAQVTLRFEGAGAG